MIARVLAHIEARQALGFLNKKVVSMYRHERAVADAASGSSV